MALRTNKQKRKSTGALESIYAYEYRQKQRQRALDIASEYCTEQKSIKYLIKR